MKRNTVVRVGAAVAVAAGVWTAVSALLPFEGGPGWVFFVGTVLATFALFAVYTAMAGTSGALGLAGFATASVGNLIFLGEGVWGEIVFPVGGGVYAVGLILLGVASLRAGAFSRWVGWLWIASVLVGIPGFAVQPLMGVFFAAGGLALGAAFALAGAELWKRPAPSRAS